MNNDKEHLQRYLNDKASAREREELMRLNREGKLDDAVLEGVMKEIFDEKSSQDMDAKRARKILAHIFSHKQQARIVPLQKKRNWVWAAAATVLIVAATGMWLFSTGKLSQQMVQENTEENLVTFTDLQNKYIALPDGSTVILNAGSALSYGESYGTNVREVTLKGEAFFDVKPDAARPFIVHSGKVTTRVLGTAFNVKAYPGEEDITVTVTKGKVQVSDEKRQLDVIIPDQQIIVNKSTNEFEKADIDAEAALEWKSEFLILDHVNLEEAVAIIARKYNVKITLANEALKRCRVMATFLKGESLTHVLTVVTGINQTQYSVKEDGSVVIDGKGCD